MSDKDWRPGVEGGDYFLHQQKQLAVADRRPVIRQASDLVGPGIDGSAVTLDDFNDLLATFNGYYSSVAGALNAPNSTEAFIGTVVSDAVLGGLQRFTGMTSGTEYTRRFNRSPVDPESLAWGVWTERLRIPPTMTTSSERDTQTLSGTAALLTTPAMSTIGQAGTFEVTDQFIRIRKQGVYTGYVQVGDRAGTTVATVSLFRPQGNNTAPTTHLSVPLGPTFYMPFTVIATDDQQSFYVTTQQSSGAARDLWYRFGITRTGDAV